MDAACSKLVPTQHVPEAVLKLSLCFPGGLEMLLEAGWPHPSLNCTAGAAGWPCQGFAIHPCSSIAVLWVRFWVWSSSPAPAAMAGGTANTACETKHNSKQVFLTLKFPCFQGKLHACSTAFS